MKKFYLIIISIIFMFSIGCATKDYVRQQIDPLLDCCKKAEAAAKKCEKSFELQQMK